MEIKEEIYDLQRVVFHGVPVAGVYTHAYIYI